ncbi:D-xylose ABC transporter substrate-binding protein [Clostridium sediminicola]|uniref:sugar ABC transporter substrate-binding protein n=1 Tax=Clostridium sediminicola TaxID=3114879 RepID=UPI0031F1CC85
MKKTKILAFMMTAVMSVALLGGCASKNTAPADDSAKADDKIVVGLSLPTQQEERWVRDKVQMESEAERLGIDLKVQVSNNDVAQQASQVENLIAQGIDVLILAPQDASAAAASVEKAHEAGIKVISYDRLIMDTDIDLYLSFDNVKVGELQGEYITKQVPKGKYIVMSGAPTDNNAKLFKEGAMKFIQPLVDSGDITIVADQAVNDWNPENALKIVENALTANDNDIQAILAPNDGTAGGAIVALTAQGLDSKVPITGQDSELAAAQRIVEGTQSMTIFKDTRELGTAAIEAAVKIAKGEALETNGAVVNNNKMDVQSLLLTPYVVDKNNIDEKLIESGYLNKDDVYKK